MDIGIEQRCLGAVDTRELRERLLSLKPQVWAEQAMRQQTYEVHRDTQSVVLLFCDEGWPNGEIYRENGWPRLADAALPLMERVIDANYRPGGTLLRAMAAKLKAHGNIPPHRDTLRSLGMGHRVHVPITSNSGVRYTISGKPFQLDVGYAYEINNQKKHSVINMGNEDRISFIFDYVAPEELSET